MVAAHAGTFGTPLVTSVLTVYLIVACSVSLTRLGQVLLQSYCHLGAVAALVLYLTCPVECLALLVTTPTDARRRYDSALARDSLAYNF